jgi:hypothetical protein
MSEKLFIFYIMKKNRLASYKKLMADRAIDMSKIFGDAPPTAIAIERIKHLKGVKRFFYLFMLIIEGNATNKEKYRAEFEMAMIHWQHDRVSSTHLEKRADQIINEELKITDAIETVEPTDVGDYIDFETVEK